MHERESDKDRSAQSLLVAVGHDVARLGRLAHVRRGDVVGVALAKVHVIFLMRGEATCAAATGGIFGSGRRGHVAQVGDHQVMTQIVAPSSR